MGTTIIALLLVLSTGRHMMAFTSAIDAKPENTSLKFTYGSSDLNGKQNGYENVYNRQLKEKYISARDRGDETSWNEANMVQKLNSTEPDENPYLRKVIGKCVFLRGDFRMPISYELATRNQSAVE